MVFIETLLTFVAPTFPFVMPVKVDAALVLFPVSAARVVVGVTGVVAVAKLAAASVNANRKDLRMNALQKIARERGCSSRARHRAAHTTSSWGDRKLRSLPPSDHESTE